MDVDMDDEMQDPDQDPGPAWGDNETGVEDGAWGDDARAGTQGEDDVRGDLSGAGQQTGVDIGVGGGGGGEFGSGVRGAAAALLASDMWRDVEADDEIGTNQVSQGGRQGGRGRVWAWVFRCRWAC